MEIVGPVRSVQRVPMNTVGYTGATHERWELALVSGATRRLVSKRVALATDWTARRTEDTRGREALLVAEPAFAPAWECFACPYVAYGVGDGVVLLLMDDLEPQLFPDVREPLGDDDELRVVDALARLHARFWQSPALAVPGLARTSHLLGVLDANAAADARVLAQFPGPMAERLARGWKAALDRLPARVRDRMLAPASELAAEWSALPLTLIHGDAKIANFARLADGRIAAFDWALAAAAPAAVELGWSSAINATRLARPKEEWLELYRRHLARHLGSAPEGAAWEEMKNAAVVTGARMLLWSKAAALESGGPAAQAEWEWWVERLEAATR